jgi:hypothetical protein
VSASPGIATGRREYCPLMHRGRRVAAFAEASGHRDGRTHDLAPLG